MSTNDLELEVFGGSDEESDWEEQEELAPLPEKEHSKKRKATPTKKSSKKKRKDESDDEELDREKEEDPYYASFQKKKKKNTTDIDITAATDAKVEAFIKRMDDAMHADREAMKDGKPAFGILNLLDLTSKTLSKQQLHESFISQDVLSVMANWLLPYEDGTPPHSSVRVEVLKLLDQLPVESHHLKDTGLGQIIAKIKKDKKELKSTRRLAHELINKWCRQIFPTASTDYVTYDASERYADALERERQVKDRAMEKSETSEEAKGNNANALSGAIADSSQVQKPKKKGREEMLSKRARVPQANLNTYAMPPPAESETYERQKQMASAMSAGDRKIKSVREARGKNSKARIVGMKIVGV